MLEIAKRLKKQGLSNGNTLGKHSGKYDEASDNLEYLNCYCVEMYSAIIFKEDVAEVGKLYVKAKESLDNYYKFILEELTW